MYLHVGHLKTELSIESTPYSNRKQSNTISNIYDFLCKIFTNKGINKKSIYSFREYS